MAFEADCGVPAVLLTPCVANTVGFLVPGECQAGTQDFSVGVWAANSKFEIRNSKFRNATCRLAGKQLTGYHSGSPLLRGTGRGV